jgi:hypothetical protein
LQLHRNLLTDGCIAPPWCAGLGGGFGAAAGFDGFALALMALLAFKYAIARLSFLKIFCLQIGPEMHKYVDHKR